MGILVLLGGLGATMFSSSYLIFPREETNLVSFNSTDPSRQYPVNCGKGNGKTQKCFIKIVTLLETEVERERDRQTERERERQTDRKGERERQREGDRQTDRQRERERERGDRERE